MAWKEYCFSIRKKGHNLEFRSNRLWSLLHAMDMGKDDDGNPVEYDAVKYQGWESEMNILDSIIQGDYGLPVAHLPGGIWGIADAASRWAEEQRAKEPLPFT